MTGAAWFGEVEDHPVNVTATSPLSSVSATYDGDGDGRIDIGEFGQVAATFVRSGP